MFVCLFRTEEDELMLFHLLNLHERNPDSGAWPFTPRPPSLMHAAGEDSSGVQRFKIWPAGKAFFPSVSYSVKDLC